MPGISILVVDDDQIYRYMANKMLLATGLADDLTFCKNGAEAWNFLEEKILKNVNLPDFIFLDINMPVMNGWELLKKITPFIKKANQKIAIYIVTSSQDEKDIKHSAQIDFISGYLVKPVLSQTFLEILSSTKY
ncbi:MAG: response regulator [Chitinophagaceae bacterium]